MRMPGKSSGVDALPKPAGDPSVSTNEITSIMRRLSYGALTLALILNLWVGARIYMASAETAATDDIYQNMELFTRALERVRKDYVDGEDLTYRELIQRALRGMLSSLDPHSEFMDVRKFDELREDTEGSFGGVGMVVGVRDEILTVLSPMENTPAFKAGIMPGDQIIKIAGQTTESLGVQEAVGLLRGKPGSSIDLVMRRPSTGEERELTLERAVIQVDTVKDQNGSSKFEPIEAGIGYVRIVQFGEQTSTELDEALKKLSAQGMKSLILDLRSNPGGLLEQAYEVCERFLPRGQLVVTTEGRRAEDRSEYRTLRRGRYSDLTLAVLVNPNSASASEIVAACLQDSTTNGVAHAVLIGERTFGKGSVQKIIPFPSGDALRLTTAKYYSPNRRVIHTVGVAPDIEVRMTETQERARLLRAGGALEGMPDSVQEELRNTPDPQLDRALEVLRGIELFSRRTPGKPDTSVIASGTPEEAVSTR
jgi:carboxyl-terminal processing protease